MFNIIETLRNYFTRELLPDNLSSEVALHFNVSKRRPYLVASCRRKCLPASAAPVYKNERRIFVNREHARGSY